MAFHSFLGTGVAKPMFVPFVYELVASWHTFMMASLVSSSQSSSDTLTCDTLLTKTVYEELKYTEDQVDITEKKELLNTKVCNTTCRFGANKTHLLLEQREVVETDSRWHH